MTGTSRFRKGGRGGGPGGRGVRAAAPSPTTARDAGTPSSDLGFGRRKPLWVTLALRALMVTSRISTPDGRVRVSNRGTWSSGSRGRAAGSTGRVWPTWARVLDVQAAAPRSLVIWTYSWAASPVFSGF